MTNLEKYNNAFVEALDVEVSQLAGLQYQGVPTWDSVGHMTLISTIEDAQRTGGFGSAVLEWMSDNDKQVKVVRMGIPDRFIEHGTVAQLQHIAGIDVEAIKARIKNFEF